MYSSILRRLGTSPNPQVIDEWMQELGLHRKVVGVSFQGREIVMYELSTHHQKSDKEVVPTLLFMSLVHGNEPMGLLALLFATQILQQSSLRGGRLQHARILFMPIVNVDAYTLNLHHGNGCRRTNLRPTCNSTTQDAVFACPVLTQDGVDINRNYPIDWDGPYGNLKTKDECSHNYHGSYPFSEPETRAVRDVILEYQVTAAMIFHSRGSKYTRPLNMEPYRPLLIHPYASSRPMDKMSPSDVQRYRDWSRAMNPNQFYSTGTANETIYYTAGGSDMDWMQSINVTAFVVEVVPPCRQRWCDNTEITLYGTLRDMHAAQKEYGVTAQRLVELVVYERVGSDPASMVLRLTLVEILISAGCIVYRCRHSMVSAMRRLRVKEKLVPAENEMQRLMVIR